MAKRPNAPSLQNKKWQPGIHTIAAFPLAPGEIYTEALINYEDYTHKITDSPVEFRYKSEYSLNGGIDWYQLTQITDVSRLDTDPFKTDEDGDPVYTNRGGSTIPEVFKILSVSNTNPCVILTVGALNSKVGDKFTLFNFTNPVELENYEATITAISGSMITIDIDSTNFNLYSGGGFLKFTDRMYRAEFELDQAATLGLTLEISDIPFHLSYDVVNIIKGTITTLVMGSENNFDIGEVIWLNHAEGMTEINEQRYSIVNKIGNDLVINVNSETFTDYTSGATIKY